MALRVLLATFILALCCFIHTSSAFYLVGAIPHDYAVGTPVPMDVNTLSSVHTHLPYRYYSLPFCPPAGGMQQGQGETIGEILMGNHVEPSPYSLLMGVDVKCKQVCAPVNYKRNQVETFTDRIKDEYGVHLLLDGLPVSVLSEDAKTATLGVPLGARDQSGNVILFNHIHFVVRYHEMANGRRQVIRFQARPYSVAHTATSCDSNFDPAKVPDQYVILAHTQNHKTVPRATAHVTWSYSVAWEPTEEDWRHRWDAYSQGGDNEVRGWSILNSSFIVLVLSAMVAAIMLRAVRKDFDIYNAIGDPEDVPDDSGWKTIAKQVFRRPPAFGLLAAYAGSGVQMIGMSVSVLIFAALGLVSPASRGALVTALLLCFVFVGVYAGFTSARLMKTIAEPSWRNTVLTATMVPGQLFAIVFLVNLAVWAHGSSAAVPFATFVILILLWLCVDLPFVLIGSVIGYKRPPISLPVPVAALKRYVPEQPWYLRPWVTIPIGGVLPFGAVFIELYFILTSVWLNRFYFVFGSLLMVFLILTITCAEIVILLTYLSLLSEDYNWWWRSFLTAGFSAVYLFLYSAFYFVWSLHITKLVPTIMYFSYMFAVSYVFFVVTGTIGFLGTFYFVRWIYASIRID